MRHGQAEAMAENDASRELTPQGRQDAGRISEALHAELKGSQEAEGTFPVFHSPFARTTQTAEIVCSTLNSVDGEGSFYTQPTKQLLGDNTASSVCDWLQSLEAGEFILVSHQPLVSSLLAWLVEGADRQSLHRFPQFGMSPASLAVLEGDMVERGLCELTAMYHS